MFPGDDHIHMEAAFKRWLECASHRPKHTLPRSEHGGGLMLLIGWKARFAAAMLGLFIIPTTLVFRTFWCGDPEAALDQIIQFSKNLAMMGGMLYIVVHAPDR